jgi:membrane-associated protein
VIVFAESGVLIGFFLPGDSLLFTAGFLASQGVLDIVPLSILLFVAAVGGDSFGYWCGKRFGPSVFTRQNSLLLDRSHVDRAEAFYAKHGGKTIILARFVPVVRCFAPILAGVGRMRYRTFVTYNLVGGAVWAFGLTWAGFYLGNEIPHIDRYLLPIIALIIIASIAPSLIHLLRTAEGRAMAGATLRLLWSRRPGAARRAELVPAAPELPEVELTAPERDSALR